MIGREHFDLAKAADFPALLLLLREAADPDFVLMYPDHHGPAAQA
jgi:hypothetical protein